MSNLNANTVTTSNLVTKGMTVNGAASTTSGMQSLADMISAPPPGDVSFTIPGTFTFIVPAGVTKINAVAIGAGGSGRYDWSTAAGSGGALAYANNIPVTPGQSISITVPGQPAQVTHGSAAVVGSFFSAQGGTYSGTSTRATFISGSVTASGGQGGLTSQNAYGGGGGAGGYTGQGGDGSYGSTGSNTVNGGNGSGGAAAGGIGYQSSTYSHGGGGGVGLFGAGSSGVNPASLSQSNDWSYIYNTSNGYGGKGGSGGEQGSPNSNASQTFYGRTTYHGEGGRYGGGGAGGGTSVSGNNLFCRGAQGAVRIMWGVGRSFPNNAA